MEVVGRVDLSKTGACKLRVEEGGVIFLGVSETGLGDPVIVASNWRGEAAGGVDLSKTGACRLRVEEGGVPFLGVSEAGLGDPVGVATNWRGEAAGEVDLPKTGACKLRLEEGGVPFLGELSFELETSVRTGGGGAAGSYSGIKLGSEGGGVIFLGVVALSSIEVELCEMVTAAGVSN